MPPSIGDPTRRDDPDGVRIVTTPGVRREVAWLALAVGLLGATAVWLLRALVAPAAPPDRPASTAPGAQVAAAAATPRRPRAVGAVTPNRPREAIHVERRTADDTGAPMPASTRPRTGPTPVGNSDDTTPTAAAPAAADDSGDDPTGIALFPPPGTKPIKRGIVVPDDFELPEGYVRHYQATDDGKMLPPILMFHPDYQPVDANGQPVPVPENRIVPPELAPAGLAIQMLEPPENMVPMLEFPDGRRAEDSKP